MGSEQRKRQARQDDEIGAPVSHGAGDLPKVEVASYNLELRDKAGFIGDRANKTAFRDALEGWRKQVRAGGSDPLGDTPTDDLSKKDIDGLLKDSESEAATLVRAAIDDFAAALADQHDHDEQDDDAGGGQGCDEGDQGDVLDAVQ